MEIRRQALRRRPTLRVLGGVVAMALAVTGCGAGAPTGSPAPSSSASDPSRATPTTSAPTIPPDNRTVQVLTAGVGAYEETVVPVAVIKNLSTHTARTLAVHFRVTGANGGVIAEVTDSIPLLGPGATTVSGARVAGQDVGGTATAVVEVREWTDQVPAAITATPGAFACTVCGARSGYGDVSTTLTSNQPHPRSPLHVAVACTDASGAIIGGGSRTLAWTADGAFQGATIPTLINAIPVECQVGVTPAA